MKATKRSSSASKRAKKQAPFTRPKTNWPYTRYPGDFRSHLEDLYFWGFIHVRPFRCIFTDPEWGLLNLDHKNMLTKIRADRRGGRRRMILSRVARKSRGRPHPNMEMIRMRAALNRR